MLGLGVAAFSLTIAATAFWLAVNVIDTSKDPQLVALVPSRGSVILEKVGDSYNLSVQGQFSDLTAQDLDPQHITYRSADPAVVSVSQEGLVTATGEGATDIAIEYGALTRSVRALIFGDVPTPPPIDPAMVGPIPDLDVELRAVLNRIVVELHPGYGIDDADAIAVQLDGNVVHSYRTFPGYVIEFNAESHTLLDTLDDLNADNRVATAYPDLLFETAGGPIDSETLSNYHVNYRYYDRMGFIDTWKMMDGIPLNPVMIVVHEHGDIYVPPKGTNPTSSSLEKELDPSKVSLTLNSSGPVSTNEHKAAVIGIIAAANDKLTATSTDYANFSGIVSSVNDLEYHIFAPKGPELDDPADHQLEELVHSLSFALSNLEYYQRHSQDIDVVNMSWSVHLDEKELKRRRNRALYASISSSTARFEDLMGMASSTTFVIAAGNCEKEAIEFFPAKLSLSESLGNVITVGGANSDYDGRWTPDEPKKPECKGTKGNSSSYGEAVTIAAQAEKTWSLKFHKNTNAWGYEFFQGTSFAAPMVTGTVALLRSIYPELKPKEMKDLLRVTADIKAICESTPAATSSCSAKDQAIWHFLRTDKAVDELLSSCVVKTGTTAAVAALDCSGFREYNVMLLAETSRAVEGSKLEKIREAIHSFARSMSLGDDLSLRVGLSSFDDTKYDTVMPIGPIGPRSTKLDAWQRAVDGLSASGGAKENRYDAITQAVRYLENLGRPRNNVLVAFMDNEIWSEGNNPYPQTLLDAIDSVETSEVALIFVTVQDPGNYYLIETPFETFMDQSSIKTPRVFYTFDTQSDVSEIYQLSSGVGIHVSPP